MAKSDKDEKKSPIHALQELAEVSTISIEEFCSVMFLTPLGDPTSNVNEPTVIWGIPICLIGLSGLGKTKRTRSICYAIDLTPHYVYAATKSPEDFSGAYVPDGAGSVNVECVLPAARRCIDAGGGCIVFDEVSDTPPRTQSALLSAVDERQFGDRVLPNKTRIALLMNPPEFATNGHPIGAPLSNRMAHRYVPAPPNKSWGEWLLGITPPTLSMKVGEKLIVERWSQFWPQVVALGAHFAEKNDEDTMHNQPPPASPQASGPWPSPRTWYMGLRAITAARCIIDALPLQLAIKNPRDSDIAAARKAKLDALEFDLLASLVGEGSARVWQTFTANFDLPSPHEMLTQNWSPQQHRLDRTMVSLTAMAEYLKAIPLEEAIPLAPAAWNNISKVMAIGQPDLVLKAARVLTKASLGSAKPKTAEIKLAADKVTFELMKGGYLEFLQ